MTLVLLHPLVAGLAVASLAVPILIHLLLRQRPRIVPFPALQFLRARQTQTIRRLRLRHWLLLLLRCLALLLLGLAMARPTLRSSLFSIDQEAPMAVALVMDDSASMAFVERGESRLAVASRLASDSIRRLPTGSKVLVVESSEPTTGTFVDVPTAVTRLEALEPQASSGGIGDALTEALKGLAQATETRKEIYIFSDQAAHAWNIGDANRVRQELENAGSETSVYVVDVGAEKRDNMTLARWKLSSEVAPAGSDVELEVEVRNNGAEGDNNVRLVIDGEPRGEKPIHLTSGQAVTLQFPLAGLAEGFHQGEISLAAGDGFAMDDVRYFSLDSRSPARVLVVAEDPAESLYWTRALSVEENAASKEPPRVEQIRPGELLSTDLDDRSVVCLLNVARPTQADWIKLGEFIARGGGVFVALGPRVDPESYNSAAAQQVLPGMLTTIETPAKCFVTPEAGKHAIGTRLLRFGPTDLGDWAVLKCWGIEPIAGTTMATVLAFSTGAPALVERTFGIDRPGRSLLFTTAAHYEPKGDPWNEISLGWSYLLLAEEIIRHLSGVSETRLNFDVGDAVTIDRRRGDPFTLYAITAPDGVVERVSLDPSVGEVTLPATRLAGQYRIDSSHSNRSYRGGFSVNVPVRESELEPMASEKIEAIFPPERISVVRDPSELERAEGTSRVGRELFPWLILLAALVFFGEAYLSNRFYRESKTPASSTA